MPTKKKANSLEANMAALEELVEKMENDDLALEDSLAHFENGIKLVSACQKTLKQTEQKVQVLIERSGQQHLEDFNEDDE